MKETLYLVVALYGFWLMAIASLNLYRGYLSGKMTRDMPAYWLSVPTMIVFVLVDWTMNRSIFLLICLQLPLSRTELVTERMARYRTDPTTPHWRVMIANFVCGLLNFFNFSSDNHC